jgi:hypothetical protein
MRLSFTIATGTRQRSHSQARVPQDSWSHFTVSGSRFPQSAGSGSRIYSPRNRVAQLYTQGLGFLFVASYDSKGYDQPPNCSSIVASRSCRKDRVENTAPLLVHWCMLGSRCGHYLVMAVIYRVISRQRVYMLQYNTKWPLGKFGRKERDCIKMDLKEIFSWYYSDSTDYGHTQCLLYYRYLVRTSSTGVLVGCCGTACGIKWGRLR